MSAKRLLVALAILLVAAALVAGVFSGLLPQAFRSGLTAGGLVDEPTSSTLSPNALDTPASANPSPRASTTPARTPAAAGPSPTMPRDVLAAATPIPGARSAAVAARVAAVPTKDVLGRVSAEVVDVATGKALYRRGSDRPLTPASTMKLLTSAAALRLLGAEHRFSTTVVQPSAGTVVLVGGGDPYLAKKKVKGRYPVRASVADLATQAARVLKKKHRTTVKVGYDDSLFTGPAWNPIWPGGYSDQVTRTSALWVDEGRLAGGSPGPRSSDPSGDAAAAFAAALRQQGVKVSSVRPASGSGSATRIASVSSMPLERIVEQLLMSSDNDAAEVLLRQAGLAAKKGGSINGGRKAVQAELARLGAWDSGTAIHDGSGLARQTVVPADTMVTVLRAAAGTKHPDLRAVITGLPVAGVEGSLRHRFGGDDTEAARGQVRGKTGTLRKVHSLAGFVRTVDGSLIAYAFLVNDPKNDFAAVVWLEKVTAAVAACGCRS